MLRITPPRKFVLYPQLIDTKGLPFWHWFL